MPFARHHAGLRPLLPQAPGRFGIPRDPETLRFGRPISCVAARSGIAFVRAVARSPISTASAPFAYRRSLISPAGRDRPRLQPRPVPRPKRRRAGCPRATKFESRVEEAGQVRRHPTGMVHERGAVGCRMIARELIQRIEGVNREDLPEKSSSDRASDATISGEVDAHPEPRKARDSKAVLAGADSRGRARLGIVRPRLECQGNVRLYRMSSAYRSRIGGIVASERF